MNEHARFQHHDGFAATLPPRPERHFDYLAIRIPDAWWSGAFAFGLAACALATSAAGQRLGAVGYLALVGLLIAFFPHFSLRANLRNAWLWLAPLWAVLSTGWSINPDRTFHSALLLAPTIAAALIVGAMPARRWVNLGPAIALFGYMIYSYIAGRSVMFADTGSGGVAMAGVTSGKNYFGHLAALSTLLSFAFFGLRGRLAVVAAALGVIDLAMSGTALVLSHASGSLLATGLGLTVGLLVLFFRHVGWQLRVIMVVAVLAVFVLYLTFGQEIQDQIYSAVLKTFNKDSDLSGRRYVWDFTDRLIAQRLMLGYGYNSFWFYTNPDAWTIWRMMGIQPMGGFNFHNLYRETLIDGGVVGLVLLIGSFLYSLARSSAAGLKDGSYTAAVRLAFITYFVVRTGVETTGFAALTVDTTLLFGFVCLPSLGRDRSAAVPPPLRRPAATEREPSRPSRPAVALRHR